MSELLKINVSEHTEKKNGLTYLSWAWAWAAVLSVDPLATWEAVEFEGFPASFAPDGSALVKTVVTIKGHSKSCWLPVMNHRNQAIKGPDAFAINTAIVRCLTKCIGMHGLGLYIYAGEDLPEETESKPVIVTPTKGAADDLPADVMEFLRDMAMELIDMCKQGKPREAYERVLAESLDADQHTALWTLLPSNVRSAIKTAKITPL
jgi:hypothetical protein